jgi:hypothetical protein
MHIRFITYMSFSFNISVIDKTPFCNSFVLMHPFDSISLRNTLIFIKYKNIYN